MGNSSTSSGNGGNLSSHEGQSFSEFLGIFDSSLSSSALMSRCHTQISLLGMSAFKIFILLTATPANLSLMWLLLRRRRTMTPSEFLGLNVSIIDILYCLYLPLDIYNTLNHCSEVMCSLQEAFITLNLFGCPLLLTCMCVERYVAVACPLVYMRLGRWEYRLALCAWVWALTFTLALLGFFSHDMVRFYLSITLGLLFLVMLLCLLGIVAVLRRSRPGEVSRTSIPLKQRALKNVIVVIVPSMVAYSPVVALVLYILVMSRSAQCHIVSSMLLFPNFGLFIGPTFYLSRIRQVSCCSKDQFSVITRTQAE